MVAHGLGILSNYLPHRCMSEANDGGVWCRAIYTTFVWNKIHSPPTNVHGFVEPIRVHGRVEALDVAPSSLPFVTLVMLVFQM